ncbi:phospholipid carrier-dependent glycosyltransferase [Bifidobacterium xylocopae]|uniref:Polyprenol-phosphate-mannose--protein mannosyltransferase n=2 Tax=Bifidobacterium xylocopae TaxID=2493119 RepID=A0A366KCT2_9BIFI|nr:phospholipid carrier-dependent glycosyltransferase [Bifidobacterium xylocopae]RBP99504.1 phospholipid carrier-dependent glycosyltransferase [Bifidobacterium xylocopae]
MALFAGLLRFVRLGSPHAVVFDETYYVKDAWTMLMTGEARDWPDKVGPRQLPVDQLFAQGDTDHWLGSAEYVVHPPVGKWCIALGLKLFGGAGNPFAWRAATALAGTIAVLILCRVALRLFHNLPIALMAGFLLSIDGLGLTMSRTGLLDNFIMVFALSAFACLLAHRDWARDRLHRAYARDSADPVAPFVERANRPGRLFSHPPGHRRHRVPTGSPLVLDSSGPFIACSWWRLGAAVLLGLATGTKWSGAYFFAVFAILSVLWDAYERRRAGYRGWLAAGVFKDGLPAAAYMVPAWAATYLASWAGWLAHTDGYLRDWAATHPGQGQTWLPPALRSLVEYHQEMWRFHTSLDTPHPYMANPLTWPLQIRPTSFYWQELPDRPGLCTLSPGTDCVASVTSLGNPILWWLACVCCFLGLLVALLFRRGDWRYLAVISGPLAGWLPWVQYLHRTTFTFYAVVILPWMILAVCYLADWLRLNLPTHAYRRTCSVALWTLGLVSLFFYPVWTALPVPYWFWAIHMWLPSWV